ncbi:uncharacterized protein E5676_scaffold343G00360 [Cucumis melo var. makuwa]|uniref:Uncharacterized protein n=1 Tax=Cucumis melo var. makuwa TaxID=1194695 RepID=A0A5A7SKK7_CUCMM|nr:uncharacterized protein E6C27_scaffold19G002310 [Cucumis melo var. makuwa]TYK30711.1 uncharacterized protein E5676_scaffold343G00360 [Cucumis melo var. makuwa]
MRVSTIVYCIERSLSIYNIVQLVGASEMRWHKDRRVEMEDVLRHLANVEGWKHFDSDYLEFALDPRNVCLALTSNGFNLFGHMSTAYSMQPMVLIPYNFRPWKFMKDSNF